MFKTLFDLIYDIKLYRISKKKNMKIYLIIDRSNQIFENITKKKQLNITRTYINYTNK